VQHTTNWEQYQEGWDEGKESAEPRKRAWLSLQEVKWRCHLIHTYVKCWFDRATVPLCRRKVIYTCPNSTSCTTFYFGVGEL